MLRIRLRHAAAAAGFLLLLLILAHAAPAVPAAGPAPADTAAAEIPALTVTGQAPGPEPAPLPPAYLDRHDDGHLGEALLDVPGVWAVRRAASGTEPVLRGLGFERVQTRLGAVPLHGACPGRMDPPVTYLGGPAADRVAVGLGASASAGPGAPGGTIAVDPDYERPPGAAPGWTPFAGAGFGSAREEYRLDAGVRGGTDALDLRAAVGARRAHDYDAPDGRTVPAGLKEAAADLSAGWRPADGHRLWAAARVVREEDIAYPALPMDNRETDFVAVNAGWRQDRPDGRFALTGGLSAVDHLMDNADKPNRAMMAAATDAETRTWAVRARYDLAAGPGDLAVGADLTGVRKDALRVREVRMPAAAVFRDHVWPDARQHTVGLWARLARDVVGGTTLSLEGRFDTVDSEARAADDPSLGGLSVRQQYAAFYGPAAARTDRAENVGQAALRLDGRLGGRTAWHLRGGLAGRPAGLTERYNAFGPAPGGFLVGNPDLRVEKTLQTEAGLRRETAALAVGLTVFHALVRDHVLPTVVARRDIDGDGTPDAVKGFVNRDAVLAGGELAVVWRPDPRLHVPASLAFVRGRNIDDDRDLPEIPALGGRAEARVRPCRARDAWLLAGVRFAADQPRIDPVFGEDRTGGWAVWHAGLEARPRAGLRARLMVENLFDRMYHDHLSREAVLPVGGLAAGDEVPAPGRSLQVSLRGEF